MCYNKSTNRQGIQTNAGADRIPNLGVGCEEENRLYGGFFVQNAKNMKKSLNNRGVK